MTTINDEKSSPQARASRLKRARNLANLSRIEMCQGGGFSLETLKGWENCRHGGLSKNGALKVVKRLALAGVICTVDWLLYEIGELPQINASYTDNDLPETQEPPISIEIERENVAEEFMIFRTHHPKALNYVVSDLSMLPYFTPHDIVAGLKIKNLENAIGKYAIVVLENGKKLLRMISKSNESGRFNLISTNPQAEVEDLFLTNVTVKIIAPVIWHRKHWQDNN